MSASLPAEVTIDVGLDEPQTREHLRARAARALGVAEEALPPLHVRKRSLDARHGSVRFHVLVEIGEVAATELASPHLRDVGPARVVVVGAGPAGLLCAYGLARRGIGCAVVDRGKPVQPRRRDLRGLNRQGIVDPDSNYC